MEAKLLEILKGDPGSKVKVKVIPQEKLRLTCLNLKAVSTGVRDAFLWDTTGSMDSQDKARKVCHMLMAGTKDDFTTLVIGGDYLFCKTKSVRDSKEFWLQDRTLIDIGGRLPRILPIQDAEIVLDKMKIILSDALSKINDGISTVNGENVNLTTLVGLILGYPVVYYWDLKEEDESGSCLDGSQLEVASVWSGGINLYQFSYPLVLKEEVQDKVNTWKSKLEEFSDVEVKSEVVSQIGKLAM